MKKKTKLILMAVVLLVLIGAVAVVSIINAQKEANQPVEESSDIVSTVMFDLGGNANIASLEITCGNDVYTLIPDGYNASGSQVWKMKEHMDWEISYVYSYILGMGNKFYAYKDVETDVTDPARLDEFGLKNPKAIIRVTSIYGETHEIRIGERSSDRTYAFCQVDDDKTVYACDATFYTYATLTSGGIRQASIRNVVDTEGTLVELHCQKSGERPVHIVYDETVDATYNVGAATYIGTNLKFEEPYNNKDLMVYTGLQGSYFAKLPELEVAEVVDPNCQDLAQYGLSDEDPQLRETLTSRNGNPDNYTYNTTDYVFGYTYHDGEYIYFREGDSNLVMGVVISGMEGRIFTPFEFVNQLMFYEVITNVESGTLTIDGQTYELDILRQELDEENGITEENRLTVYYLDGQLVETDAFTGLYRAMISVAPDYEIYATEPVMDTSDIVTFTLNLTNGEQNVVTYYRTSEFYYVAQVADDLWFAASTRYMDDIRAALAECMQ